MSTKKSKAATEIFSKILGYVSFGEMLNSIRLSEAISQKAFAKKLGISTSELCDLEKGRKFLSLQRATKFAKKLDDSPEVFIQYVIQDEILRAGLSCLVKILPNRKAAQDLAYESRIADGVQFTESQSHPLTVTENFQIHWSSSIKANC